MTIYTVPVGAIQTNCYIIKTKENHGIIVDPGDWPERIIETIKHHNIQPKVILLTHGHFDHIGGVKELMEAYPDITLYIGEQELPIVEWSQTYLSQMGFPQTAPYIVEHALLLRDGDKVTVDELTFQTMHTPGHTQGGVIYIVEHQETIFCGDTVFREEIGRCDLPSGDYATMLATLKKIAALPGDYAMYPGHDRQTTLAHERKHNPYFNQ